eukprot:6964663-Prymnesium_polylepis.2
MRGEEEGIVHRRAGRCEHRATERRWRHGARWRQESCARTCKREAMQARDVVSCELCYERVRVQCAAAMCRTPFFRRTRPSRAPARASAAKRKGQGAQGQAASTAVASTIINLQSVSVLAHRVSRSSYSVQGSRGVTLLPYTLVVVWCDKDSNPSLGKFPPKGNFVIFRCCPPCE